MSEMSSEPVQEQVRVWDALAVWVLLALPVAVHVVADTVPAVQDPDRVRVDQVFVSLKEWVRSVAVVVKEGVAVWETEGEGLTDRDPVGLWDTGDLEWVGEWVGGEGVDDGADGVPEGVYVVGVSVRRVGVALGVHVVVNGLEQVWVAVGWQLSVQEGLCEGLPEGDGVRLGCEGVLDALRVEVGESVVRDGEGEGLGLGVRVAVKRQEAVLGL